MRLPRAEDEVVMFIEVDGEPVRAEGYIQRVTLRSGFDMLRGTFVPVNRRVSGEITVTLRAMAPVAELKSPMDEIELEAGEVIQIREAPREIPPSA